MWKIKLLNNLAGIPRHRGGETQARRDRRRKTGLISLFLFVLLIFTSTPVSASESPSRLLETAPFAFSKTSPTNGLSGQPTSLTLDWEDSKFADTYDYCIDITLNSACDGNNWLSAGAVSFKDITVPSYNTTYEWQVRATNELGTTLANSGTWYQFTTVVAPPPAFTKTSPTDGALNQALSLTLEWEESTGATSYEYCYDSTLDNTCAGSWSSTTETSTGISELSYATQYEWQVRAVNSNPLATYANGGTWWHFTTTIAPPGAFSKSSPGSGATGQSIEPTLSWESSSGATQYYYCYEEYDGDGTCGGSWVQTYNNSANISSLSYAITYSWQVYADNENPSNTYADDGLLYHFTTQAAPGPFTKSIPTIAAINQPTTLTISWTDYTLGSFDHYEYCINTTLDQTCLGDAWIDNTGTDTSEEVYLTNDFEYEWQVRAVTSLDPFTSVDANDGETPEWWTFTTIVAAPGAFNKTSPGTGTTVQNLSLDLTWEVSTGATSYKYCIDESNDTNCDTVWNSVTTNYTEISGLAYDTNYYWQVRAYNDNPTYTRANSGTWWTFETVVPPPGNFYKSSPANGAINQPISLTLDWSTSSGATEYEYCIDDTFDQECTSPATWTSVETDTEVSLLTGLSYDTQYEWQVQALNANDYPTFADFDTWWTFTTVAEAPGDFIKTDPGDTASGVDPSLGVTLQWEESARAETYWYCIDSIPNLTCNGSWILTDTSTSTDLNDLNFNITYEWQIRADNANPLKTYADAGDWHLFTTVVQPPGNFNKSSPTIGAGNQPINNLTLSWGTSNAATSYEYCIDSDLSSGHVNSCDTTWTKPPTGDLDIYVILSGLSNGMTYEWQIRADNAYPGETYANTGEPSEWWTFTTVVAAPGAFSKLSPAHASIDLLPSSITLQWEASARATSYWYCIDATLNDTCNASWITTGTNTSVSLTNLDFNATYEWQVRADNANPVKTYANGNTWWQFSTRVGTLPGSFSKQYPLDTAVDQPTNPTLQWSAASNTTRYEYCIVLATGSCTAWVDNGTSRQITISGLTLSKQYKWQVRAWNDTLGPTYSNSGNYWTFTTVSVAPPGAFGKLTPATGSTNLLPPNLTLTWAPSTNVSIYEYCYDATRDSSCSSEWKSTTGTSVAIADLTYGKQYEWQVRAFKDGNPNPTLANDGTWWTFTTTVTQPGAFNKSEPINDATDRPIALTLTWGASTGATSYQYCYEVYDGDNTCNGSWLEPYPITNNSANISGLSYATTYSWQVRAINANPAITYANNGTWYQFITIISPPAGFSKSSPANGATNQPLNMTLAWNPSNGATSYAYCYDATVDSSCTGTWTATTATSANIAGLNYATIYQWQVRATNKSGTTYANTGTQWTFTTVATPAGAFNKTSPIIGATGQPIDPTLTWDASSGATEYQYCIDITLDSTCDGDAWVSTANLRSANLIGLSYLTTYQWQVRAKSANPNWTYANSGTWRLFTTQIAPPDPFDKISPEFEAPNQPNRPYLSWEASNGATGYAYCLDTTLNGSCDGTWVSTSLLYTYVTEPELTYGATYEWQVMASNGTGTMDANDGDVNEWWTFDVKAEPANSKANPFHEYINQPLDLEITWTNVTGALWYEYCIDAETDPDGTCEAGWSADPIYVTYANLTDLSNGTTYEWQVRAAINMTPEYVYANATEDPEWWTFTTVESAPEAFVKSSPSNSATAQKANGLTLSWVASSTATGYRYCLDTNETNDTCDTSWIPVGAGTTSVVVSNLVYGETYSWQVMATNNNPDMTAANDGEEPEWWTFTTTLAPPEAFDKLSPQNNALDQLINLTLSWQSAVGASKYEYCIDTTLDSVCDGDAWISPNPVTSTTAAITGLLNATPYEWQVRAFSANPYEPTLSNGGEWFLLTTVVTSPEEFNKIGPVSGLPDQPVDLMISWEASPGATGYEYCVDSNLVNPGCDGVWMSTSSTQAIITGLTNRTEYEWQVRAVNANPVVTESDGGSWFNFSTVPLHLYLPVITKARLLAPTLNPVTIGTVENTYTLTWNAIAGATKYKVWESLSNTFTTPTTYETTSPSFTLPPAKNPTRYYYYVVALSNSNSSPPSNIVVVNRQYELEDNDGPTTSNGQIFSGITYFGQVNDMKDYYKIYMDSPGTITVTMTTIPASWPGQLQLFEEDTGNLRDSDLSPSNGMTVTYTGNKANWYYIYIATGGSYSNNWYAFTVTITH